MLDHHLDVGRQGPIDGGVGVGHILLPQRRVLAPSQGAEGARVNILSVTLSANIFECFIHCHELYLDSR